MPVLYNLYSDPQCSTPAKSGKMGALYLNAQLRNESSWNKSIAEVPPRFVDEKRGLHIYTHYGILKGMAATSPNTAWFSLNRVYGGYGLFAPNYILNDNKTQSDTTKVPNAFFISKHNGTSPTHAMFDGSCIVLQVFSGLPYNNTEGTGVSVGVQIIQYGQNPSPSDGTRTQWDYFTSNTQQLYSFDISQKNDSLFSNIGFAKITLPWGTNGENINFVAVLGNFDDNGEFQPENTGYTGCIMLFPEELWTDSTVIPPPYIGPVSKDSADTSFVPDRGLIHDSIASRDLSAAGAKNPYGFNTGNLKLYKIASNVYYGLTHRIFNAASGSLINSIGQLVNTVVGGNSHRPSDEVDTIIKSIMCCHLVPDIDTIPAGDPVAIQTIGGYPMGSSTFYTGRPLSYSIIEKTRGFVKITPTWNSFIDYEPYTTISLHIPFIGNIDIPPSVLYGNNLALHYVLDAFSGTLSVDVLINDIANGNTYIYTTLQTSCNTQLPIVGTGSNGDALLKIATGLTGAAISTSPMTKIGSIFSVYSGLADTQKSVPHTNFSQSNIAAYLDSRHCYLIIQSASPANAETFLTDKGYTAHLSGVVNDFAGVGVEMHCRFESVDLTGLSKLTEQEKQEVESMLKTGAHIRKV